MYDLADMGLIVDTTTSKLHSTLGDNKYAWITDRICTLSAESAGLLTEDDDQTEGNCIAGARIWIHFFTNNLQK
jgi:hypothetical protein